MGGAMALIRPTAEEYDQALQYYRTGAALDVIADRLGLDLDVLEQLENDGWPEEDGKPALAALRTYVLERLTRIRAGELDLLTAVAETASKTAAIRSRTAQMFAQIENAMASTWAKEVTRVMKAGTVPTVALDGSPTTRAIEAGDLTVSKGVLDNLKALRALQDPEVDRGYVDIFVKMGGRDPEDGGESLEDTITRDLLGLTKEQLEVYVATGKMPSRQQELPFPTPPPATEQGAAA
jgi:hypothetical protein